MNDDERYMRDALREAGQAAAEGEIPIGAVVVCRGRVISRGHNMTERLHDPSAHAEMIALTAATEALGGKYLTDCTLYVTTPCSARRFCIPRPRCAGACWPRNVRPSSASSSAAAAENYFFVKNRANP